MTEHEWKKLMKIPRNERHLKILDSYNIYMQYFYSISTTTIVNFCVFGIYGWRNNLKKLLSSYSVNGSFLLIELMNELGTINR